MERTLYKDLQAWKANPRRKPLLLQGARQVGKTWLVTQFGQREYSNFVYLNFEQNPSYKSLFEAELSPSKIVENIGLLLGKKVFPKDTLLFFDEIQIAPKAITALKYFQEQASEYHIIAAGSLLGVSVGKPSNFPVGKVNFLTLYPMSFVEYLAALGEDVLLDALENKNPNEPFPESVHRKLLEALRLFLFLGGMPEPLSDYIERRDIATVREIQKEILFSYQRDFSKYTDAAQAIKTAEVWQSVPYQLAKENKKFQYSDVRKKARAATFETTIDWLSNAGLIHPVHLLRTPKLPLSGYADYSKFKLYSLDTGLLAAQLDLDSSVVLNPNQLFKEYNGAFTENYVALELIKSGFSELFYWTSGRSAEVDFILKSGAQILPIKVKSGMNKNTKSLRVYTEKYKPQKCLRLSPRNFTVAEDFLNVPLYAAHWLEKYL